MERLPPAGNFRPSRDGLGLTADRLQRNANLFYKMEADIGMPSMHRKCLDILPN